MPQQVREREGEEYPLCRHVWLSGFRKAESEADRDGEYSIRFSVVCEVCPNTWIIELLVN